MDIPIKTSQTEFSDPGGAAPSAPAQQWGNEPTGVPGPVTEPIKGEIIKKGIPTISQTSRDLPEGE
jgi:hypothetical protein